ncbi:MAG: hypothetical protein U9Q07_03190 [Planctomycetota bacterium]|nr:hypothetical protein [Planctomycetota bacterium]
MGWIKMRSDLGRSPAVLKMYHLMPRAKSVNAVLGAILRLLWLADEQTKDGILDGYSEKDLDKYVGIKGFSAALSDPSVQWLAIEGNSIQILDYAKHNGESAKQRANTAKRMAKARTKIGNTTNAGTVS